jgi:hypothetical protein
MSKQMLSEEFRRMQVLAGLITEEYNINEETEDEILAAMKQAVNVIDSAEHNAKPSPKDGNIEELGGLGIAALITGAPGILNVLGKGVDLIGKAFGKNKTKIGSFLQKKGHQLEDIYINSLGGWLKKLYPKKYGEQDVHDKTTKLYDDAHKIYGAMLIGAAVVSGYEAGQAANIVAKGVEGGLTFLKGKEVLDVAQKIAAA